MRWLQLKAAVAARLAWQDVRQVGVPRVATAGSVRPGDQGQQHNRFYRRGSMPRIPVSSLAHHRWSPASTFCYGEQNPPETGKWRIIDLDRVTLSEHDFQNPDAGQASATASA